MRVLVDTHTFIWALLDDKRLSAKAKHILRSDENELVFSLVSLWEIAIKIKIGNPRHNRQPKARAQQTIAPRKTRNSNLGTRNCNCKPAVAVQQGRESGPGGPDPVQGHIVDDLLNKHVVYMNAAGNIR